MTDPRRFGTRIPLAIAALAAAWAIFGSAWIFPELSANSDEGIYLLQAEALQEGRLTLPAPATDADAFIPWFATVEDDEYILKYTPPHAAVLAAGSTLGSSRIALGALAAAQVLGIAALGRALRMSPRGVAFAAILLAASPLFLQLSITYLPYGTSLALALFAATAGVRAAAAGSLRLAGVAGFLWGIALFARPYDAVLWGAAVGLALAWEYRQAVLRLLPAALAGAVIPIVVFLLFNHAVTGDALQLPFNLLEPMDKLGFGPRRALPSDPLLDFTPARGAAAVGRNLLLVLGWGGGGLIGAALGVNYLLRRGPGWRLPATLLVVWPLGYGFFWGSYLTVFVWDGGLFLGPYYFLPMVAILALVGGAGLAEVDRQHGTLFRSAAAAATVLTLLVAVPRLNEQRDRSTQRTELASAIDDAADELDAPALVMLPSIYGGYLQNPWSFLRNTPTIDGPLVFALQGSQARNERIAAEFPDRWVLVLEVPRWTDRPGFTPEITLTTVRAPLDA